MPRTLAARTEYHPIATETVPDTRFLAGESGNPATIAGALRLVQPTGRQPVVVMLHGSGGVGANNDFWVDRLTDWGICSFLIDSFTGRGLTSVNTNQALLGRLNMVLDLYRALEILAKHPLIDPARIAVMGFSRGGQGTLYAALNRFHRMYNRSGIAPAAYIPFYPDCATTYIGDTETTDRPIRIFHGISDDYNPIAPCRAYVERLKQAGRDVQLFEYPDTWHAYDNPLRPTTPTLVENAQSVRDCRIVEEAEGRLINAITGAVFTYADPCIASDPHIAHNPVSLRATEQELQRLLPTLLAPR